MQLLIVWAVSIIVFLGPSRLWASDPIPPDASSEKEQVAKRIAIVSTFRQLSPLNADWQRGIMEAVRKNYNGPIEFEIEYLDLIHNNDPMYLQGWIDLLSTKYAKKPADVVVPIYIPSLSFLLTNKQNIFQNTPIIFCSVPHSFAEFAISKYPVTGVGFEFDFKGTYKAIEALRPGTKRIVYLCGASEQDTFLRDLAELEQKNAHRDLQLEFWEGLTVPEARRKLSQEDRDVLYEGRINPIATFSDVGTVIWGNKTLQIAQSALDRLNVRRLLLQARKLISAVSVRLLFEQNDDIVRQQFLDSVNPILDSIRRDRGLYDFRVTVRNTPEDLDNNRLVGSIYIKPTRALEFIDITFYITPTGASFENV